uniref:Putative glycine-rich rna-binding protein 1 n=1 Tax=Haematobia irritans TaxID=7368 RepID=A0A1L8EIM0_HAEIR
MRLLLVVLLIIGLIYTVAPLPAARDVKDEKSIALADVADHGDGHSNNGERKARWGGYGGGWGYPRYGGGWGYPGYGYGGGFGYGRRFGWGGGYGGGWGYPGFGIYG